MLYDAFICHASEDKDDFVRPLADALQARHLAVWYDEFELAIGDSLREAIDRGLANSRFGVVVLSPNFFRKRWPQRELNGLVTRDISEDQRLILPIWHRIDREAIIQHSPTLADVFAVSSARGLDIVVNELLKKLRPEESPLVIAQNFLIAKGLSPPVVTDEWWLDLIEIKEGELRFPDLNFGRRWIFPLPYPQANRGKERGMNIAWTALQTDWSLDGEDRKICQLTRPEQVHEFLREWPGLFECARLNPAVIAMYAPQLTIPGFDDGFADVFDALLDLSRDDAYSSAGYSNPTTIDGHEPLCGELISWRHPTYGNYASEELADSFTYAHDGCYSRQLYTSFECLVWLLSGDSHWMPQRLRETLLDGMSTKPHSWFCDIIKNDNAFSIALLVSSRSKFRYTKKIRSAIVGLIAAALHHFGLS